jgi:aryl-alcohol dehydrogenase-like predicted oxidoreductase
MEHRPLGRTGVSVSKLCLGAMMFGDWGTKDHDESIRIIHRALDAGIDFIDTADAYSAGESEEIVGKALAGGRRDDIVVATKVWFPMGEGPNRRGASRRWIIREVEDSLRRLGTDWIDLYQIHRYQPDTDIEETLGALTDLIHQGKVRYLGSSTFPPSAIVEAQWAARDRHVQRFVCEQPPYSMLAEEAGLSLIEMAIAFALNHPAVTAAIIGPRTMEQLDSQLPAADVVLDQALLDRIDEIVPPGTNLNPADGGWANPALQPATRRR